MSQRTLLPPGFAPPNIEELRPYEPGRPIEEIERELGISGVVKVASNENPLGPSPKGLAAAKKAVDDVHRYPDGGAYRLRHKLAERLSVSPSEIAIGSGSNDLIDLLVRVFCHRGRHEVLTHKFAFVMYRVACLSNDIPMVAAEVTGDLVCDVDTLCAAITDKTRLIFLPNPNNPTGSYVKKSEFERLLEKIPKHVLLVVDEAYHEYAVVQKDYPVAEEYRAQHPLIVSLRTFSKVYGLASLRVGYAIADQEVVEYLNRVRLPFNVSQVAQEAALAALDDEEHVRGSREANAAGMKLLTDELVAMDLRVFPSVANFVLVDFARPIQPFFDAMLKNGVIVRPLGGGLPTHARVSVGSRDEIKKTVGAIQRVLSAG